MVNMLSETQSPTDEQYINALSEHLGDSVNDESLTVLATLVHCTKVLSDDAEGIKKDCAADIRTALSSTTRKYSDLVAEMQTAIKDGRAVEIVQPFMVVEAEEESTDESVEDEPSEMVADEDEQPEVVEEPQPEVVGLTEDMVRAIINEANASLLKKIRRELGKMPTASSTPVAKATPKKETTPKVEEQPEVVEESTSGLKTRSRKPYTPSGWKDKVNYSVAVIYDQVDKGQQVAIVKGMTPTEATASGRNSIRRHLIRAFDATNGNKDLTKATQDKETWVAVAAEHGITDAVCDLFLTNPNKYVQQSRRTGLTRRTKLGITDTDSFIAVANENIGTSGSVATKPSLFDNDAPKAEASTVATVDTDLATMIASLIAKGLSPADAAVAASAMGL